MAYREIIEKNIDVLDRVDVLKDEFDPVQLSKIVRVFTDSQPVSLYARLLDAAPVDWVEDWGGVTRQTIRLAERLDQIFQSGGVYFPLTRDDIADGALLLLSMKHLCGEFPDIQLKEVL